MTAALAGIRVIDRSGPEGNYCGKLFAELGADVILVEPPGGTALRGEPPFVAGCDGDPEASLRFLAYNTSKRSVALNLGQAAGQEILRDLAGTADLLIETDPPGWAAARGIGYQDLARRNRRLVVTSITPFGQDGPYSGQVADDLTCLAFGGLLSLGGYADGPPVQAAGQQAYAAASVFAAVASMLALLQAEGWEQGQHIDVSVQECVVMGLETAIQAYDLEGQVRGRTGGITRRAGQGIFPCRDGHVFLLATGLGEQFWVGLLNWLDDEGVPGIEVLRGDAWTQPSYLETAEAKDSFLAVFGAFCRPRAKAELYRQAQKWRVPLCPVNTPGDVVSSAQLAARQFFVQHPLPHGRTALMPGAPYRLSQTPWQMTRPAPRLGQHTGEVLRELGYTGERIAGLRRMGAI
jgi:benzylsuccinate CoA-transferase BbsE subunit